MISVIFFDEIYLPLGLQKMRFTEMSLITYDRSGRVAFFNHLAVSRSTNGSIN